MIRLKGLTFAPDFKQKAEVGFKRKQEYIDNTTLRFTEQYMPKRTGTMIRSGTLGTRIGSGVLEYIAPYARNQYYTNSGRGMDGINAVTVDKLPTSGNTLGDVWDVQSTGMNYAWNGSAWDALGQIFSITAISNAEIDAIIAG